MSRMLDRLLTHGLTPIPPLTGLGALLRPTFDGLIGDLKNFPPVVVDADNVAEYLYAGTDKNSWDLDRDFPNVAPPWPNLFIEFRSPAGGRTSEGPFQIDKSLYGTHRAISIHSAKCDQLLPLWKEQIRNNETVPWPISAAPESGWFQISTIFIQLAKDEICPIARMPWLIRADGSIVGFEAADSAPIDFFGYELIRDIEGAGQAAEFGQRLMGWLWPNIWIAALTLSFIHCRNTVLIDHSPAPAQQKANRRRGKPPLVSYKTLEIEPVKRLLATKGNAATMGLKQALHICRGHFKDYRERGLFGKLKGMYWWDMCVRGESRTGSVLKDYRVTRGDR